MDKVIHFEIPSDDLAQAQDFYRKVFGWGFKKWDNNYITVYTADHDENGHSTEVGAINGGLQKRGPRAAVPTIVIGVKDIDSKLNEIMKNGGMIVVPKESLEGEGYYAQFEDPDGNRIGVFQPNV